MNALKHLPLDTDGRRRLVARATGPLPRDRVWDWSHSVTRPDLAGVPTEYLDLEAGDAPAPAGCVVTLWLFVPEPGRHAALVQLVTGVRTGELIMIAESIDNEVPRNRRWFVADPNSPLYGEKTARLTWWAGREVAGTELHVAVHLPPATGAELECAPTTPEIVSAVEPAPACRPPRVTRSRWRSRP